MCFWKEEFILKGSDFFFQIIVSFGSEYCKALTPVRLLFRRLCNLEKCRR